MSNLNTLRKLFLFLTLVQLSLQSAESDLVSDLPDFPYKGRIYSGYLELEDNLKQFHYFFVEAQKDSENAPLVLWLNGGPGCSSMLGMLLENGPAIFPDFEDKMKLNEYSWNKVANMIYLESPGNVGFSYIDSFEQQELYVDDDSSAVDNFQAMKAFFNKFPSFKNNDFYISGESYAGIYIPRLAAKIIEYNKGVAASKKINLKGFLVGNGVASWEYDTTNAQIDFAFSHHLYSYEQRLEYNEKCIKNNDEEECDALLMKFYMLTSGLNIYDLLQDCGIRNNTTPDSNSFYYKYAKWAFPKNIQSKAKNFLADILEQKVSLTPQCFVATAATEYLNRADVKEALHVKETIEWDVCSDSVKSNYNTSDEASLYLYPLLIKEKLRILIFSGDTDMVVPYNGNQKWISTLGLEVKSPWRSWRAFDDNKNIAGYRTIYDGLTFVTVKGTGHMVAQWKPKEAFYMFSKFLKDEDL